MKILLATTALSVMLLVSGAAFADNHMGDNQSKDGKEGKQCHMEPYLSKLPEADAEEFHDAMKAAHEKDKASFDKMKTLEEELKTLLSAEKFDKAAFLAKSSEISKLHDKIHRHHAEAFAAAVAHLPAEQRAELSEHMMEWHQHGHHHHDKKDGDEKSDSENTSENTKE